MTKQLKPVVINNTEEAIVARKLYDVLASGEENEVLEGDDKVTMKPYNYNTLKNPSEYDQESKDMRSFIQVHLCAGENQVLSLLPSQIRDLDGIVVSMDQNNRFRAKLVRRQRDYPYILLRYWFPFLEALWVQERIVHIFGAPGELLDFQPSNPVPAPEA